MKDWARNHAIQVGIVGSFAIYLLPIVGHAILVPWGAVLWTEISEGGGTRAPLWFTADLAVAALAQFVAGCVIYALARHLSWLRTVAALLFFQGLAIAVFWSYQIALPRYFLVADEVAPAHGTWPVACTVDDAWLAAPRTGVALELERAGEAWVTRGEDRRYGTLAMPDCRTQMSPANLTVAGAGIDFVGPGGAMVLHNRDPQSGENTYSFVRADMDEPAPTRMPEGLDFWLPVLSSDARAVGWLDIVRAPDRRVLEHRLHVRELDEGTERVISLDQPLNASLGLLSFDAAGEFLLKRNAHEVLAITDTGAVIWGPHVLDDVSNISTNVRRVGNGWVAWDTDRGDEGPRVVWSLTRGSGSFSTPKGRSITKVAVNPTGTLIAVSYGSNLTFADVPHTVVILSAADGGEVYRRYTGKRGRSQIAFLGDEYLALSLYEGDTSRIEVLRVPATE